MAIVWKLWLEARQALNVETPAPTSSTASWWGSSACQARSITWATAAAMAHHAPHDPPPNITNRVAFLVVAHQPCPNPNEPPSH